LFDGLKSPDADQQSRMKRYPLLDPLKFFARGAEKNTFTIPSSALIKETTGKHDVYFIFRGNTEQKDGALFPLAEIEFKH
jgi:hypothetical protein